MRAYCRRGIDMFSLFVVLLPMCSIRCDSGRGRNADAVKSEDGVASTRKEMESSEADNLMGKPPLTEEMVISMSKRALREKGYDVSALVPVEYSSRLPPGHKERLFQRFKKAARSWTGRS